MSPPSRRGEHLLRAAHDVVVDAGIGALSVRSVASRAGVSPAQVQYYFRTKGELVAGAFEAAGDQFIADLGPVLEQPASLARLHQVLAQWLPLDAARERRARLWVAFTEAALADPALLPEAARTDGEVRSWLSEELATLRDLGEVRSDLGVVTAATALLALVDGLTVQALATPEADRGALVSPVLDSSLEALLG